MSVSQAALANLRPFGSGPDPRRNMLGPMSKAEREFRALIEAEHIPGPTIS